MGDKQANILVEPVEEARPAPQPVHHSSPIAEPHAVETLEQHAAHLAASHQLSGSPARQRLLGQRTEENVLLLLTAYQRLAVSRNKQPPISPAALCLVNNFPIIEKQLREICINLKPDYDDLLPKLSHGPLAAYPRIFDIVLSLITHTQGHLDAALLERYFRAYQGIAPLSNSELMSVPVMLRLALIELLSRTTDRIINSLEGQAEAELSIANIIASLRWLSNFDASLFLESVSLIHAILSLDPSTSYPSMEPSSRQFYRRALIALAAAADCPEPLVAQHAIDLAALSLSSAPDDSRGSHVGFYLLDDGLPLLERSLAYSPPYRIRLSRALRAHPAAFYLSLFASLCLLLISSFFLYAFHLGASALMLAILVTLCAIPVSDLVLNALNACLRFAPTLLPKLDFSHGIPAQARTMTVIPCLLSSEAMVRELVQRLEEHYLSNQDEELYFALLSDWSDARQETMAGDEELLATAVEAMQQLNARYEDGERARFYLFHRRRQWNGGEAKWIGWERKRGKLREFNRLLRGATDTTFLSSSVEKEFLAGVRYVLTLDYDTHLGRDAARRLVGTISHPLNQGWIQSATKRVVKGYGIIQPRVTALPAGAERGRLPLILTNRFDINEPSAVISNLHQDLFGETNYVGKGLYEVDIFEAALGQRVAENRLLSHDLLEGMYVRAGLASDITIYEGAETDYEGATRRQHRWTRGDWQVLPWLMRRVREEGGGRVRNVLPVLGRWKIVDTLRRSLMPLVMVLWLLAGWILLPGSPAVWTLLIILTLSVSLLFSVAPSFHSIARQAPRAHSWKEVQRLVKVVGKQVYSLCVQLLISFTFIAHHSYLLSDAIIRALYRRLISHRHLLEWVTAAQVKRDSARSTLMFLRYMWSSPVIALACGVLIFVNKPAAFPAAAPFLLAWIISPYVANLLSGRMRSGGSSLELDVEHAIRLNGRRMWRALESFLGLKYNSRSTQKSPRPLEYINPLRSSPVNLARLLLWTEAIYELGSIGIIELAERLDLALSEMRRLPRSKSLSRETFDARGLGPLAPNFILHAENGNLAGHLRTLKQFCSGIVERPLFDERVLKGFADTITLLKRELLRISPAQQRSESVSFNRIQQEIEASSARLPTPEQLGDSPLTVTEWHKLCGELAQRASIVEEILAIMSQKKSAGNISELRNWNGSLIRQAQGFSRDLSILYPWAAIAPLHLIDALRKESATAFALWRQLMEQLEQVGPLTQLPEVYVTALVALEELRRHLKPPSSTGQGEQAEAISEWNVMKSVVEKSLENSKHFISLWSQLSQQSGIAAEEPNLRVLFDVERRISRGY